MNRFLAGTLAGVAATAPMTAVMELMHRLPVPERDALPPHQITVHSARKTGLAHLMDEDNEENLATAAAHFGYGGAAGAIYGPVAEKLPGHPAVKGMAFGMLLWTGSYLGWLPAANIIPPATEHSARRNTLMILAHLVWGASLGIMTEKWADKAHEE